MSMEGLSISIQNQFLIELIHLKPDSKLESTEVLRYLHTAEKRGDSSFPIHECLGLAKIDLAGQGGFVLGLFTKTRKCDWGLDTIECGDRSNPPHPPFHFFDCRPTSTEIANFIAERHAFEVRSDQRVLTNFSAGASIPGKAESLTRDTRMD